MTTAESARERLVTLGVPILLGVAPLVFLPIAGEFENIPKAGFLQCGIAALALAWLLWPGGVGPTIRGRNALDLPVVLFFAACCLSLVQAVNAGEAMPVLLHWGTGVTLFVLMSRVPMRSAAVPRLFLAATLGCSVVCLIGLAQAWLGLEWIPQSAPPASTFANRNMASHFVAICFPLAIGVAVSGVAWTRALGGACLVLAVAYLATTETRSAWLAVLLVGAVSLAGFPMLARGRRPELARWRVGYVVAALLLVALAVGLLFAAGGLESEGPLSRRLASAAGADTGTAGLRLIFWKNTLAMIRDQPILGVGLGNFELQYPLYHRAAEIDWTFDEEHQLERVHNDHLQILAETGLVGFVAWLSIFAVAFRVAWKCGRGREEQVARHAFWCALGVVALAIVACFSFPMERALPPIFLFALLGTLGGLATEGVGADGRGRRLHAAVRWATVPVLTALLATSVVMTRRAVTTEVLYAEGVRGASVGDHARSVTALERARRVSPRNADVLLQLAAARIATGECEEAMHRLRDVRRLQPYKVNAISNIGYCQLQLQDYTGAERSFLETLELIPDSPETHTNLGSAYFGQGEYERAVNGYARAIELAETKRFLPSVRAEARSLQPRLLLARTYVVQGDLESAIELYQEMLGRYPERDDIARVLTELKRRTGRAGS